MQTVPVYKHTFISLRTAVQKMIHSDLSYNRNKEDIIPISSCLFCHKKWQVFTINKPQIYYITSFPRGGWPREMPEIIKAYLSMFQRSFLPRGFSTVAF